MRENQVESTDPSRVNAESTRTEINRKSKSTSKIYKVHQPRWLRPWFEPSGPKNSSTKTHDYKVSSSTQ